VSLEEICMRVWKMCVCVCECVWGGEVYASVGEMCVSVGEVCASVGEVCASVGEMCVSVRGVGQCGRVWERCV